METKNLTIAGLLFVVAVSVMNIGVIASDPELTTDFFVQPNVNAASLDGSYFTSTVLRNVTEKPGLFATVTPVNLGVFQALEGLGVSAALLQYPAGGLNVLHTHPRGTELLCIVRGTLDVGLIDSTNKLYTQTLQVGDLFVFPKGLVHYQSNPSSESTIALASFSSSNPGLERLPNTLFKSSIPSNILTESFGVSTDVINQLIAATVN